MITCRNLKNAALLAAVINFLASMAMLFILKPGLTPENGIETRFEYIRTHSSLWTASWLVWIFAAISLIYFLIQWSLILDQITQGRYRGWIVLGGVLGCLGMIPDSIAEVLYLGLIPEIAQQNLGVTTSELHGLWVKLQEWERVAMLLTGFLGNGFYCLGGLILQSFSFKARALPGFCRMSGFVMWIAGLSLSVATLFKNIELVILCTALTMAGFVLWSFLIYLLPHPAPEPHV